MKLERKITVTLMVPMLIVLLTMAIVTLSVLVPNALDWRNRVKKHIVDEELKNLGTRTANVKELTALNFGRITNDITVMKEYADELVDGELPDASYYPNFFGVKSVDPTLPPGTSISASNANYSVWFNKQNPTGNQQTEEHLNITSIMDNVWRAVTRSSSKYAGIYIGMETGLFRHLPYFNQEHYATLSYICLQGNQPTIGYDPRCRGWYISAKNDLTKVHFTEPYNDASTGDVLISASFAIMNGSTFIGSTGLDISMGDLESFILAEEVLENGYTYLVDTSGRIVVYPDLKRDRIYTLSELEFESGDDASDFGAVFAKMKTQRTGQEQFTKDGEDWWVTFSKVDGTDYIVGMVVPNKDITKSVDDIQNKVNVAIIIASVLIFVFLVLMVAASIFTNRKITNKIVNPIRDLDHVTSCVTQGDLDVELGEIDAQSPELRLIYNNFSNLLKAVKYANKNYQSGDSADMKSAYEDYKQVETMLGELHHDKPLGAVYNNLGLVLEKLPKIQNHLEQAEKYFDLAIKNAEKYIEKGATDEAKCVFKIRLAGRYMNLGLHYAKLYYANNGDPNRAEKIYKKSIRLHKEADDKLGEIKTMGNLGNLYLHMQRDQDAWRLFDEAYTTACARYDIQRGGRMTEKNATVLQYAAMNMGTFYKMIGDFNTAIQFFNYSLGLRPTIDINLKNMCLFNLMEIHGRCGNLDLANQIKEDLKLADDKGIFFVIDVSGSMFGIPNQLCQNSINMILREHMDGSDCASLLKFDKHYKWVFINQNVSKNLDNLIHQVNTQTMTGHGTSFYAAVLEACQQVVNGSSSNKSQWIVALTDGVDFSSESEYGVNDYQVRKYVKKYNLNVIVITVGDLHDQTISTIESIVGASPNGLQIRARDTDSIRGAFSKAIKVINEGQVALETL